MTPEQKKRLHTVYSLILSASILIAGLCFMAACLDIYRSGDQPFSREAVAQRFSGIAIPVYLCAALTAAGFLLDLFLPAESKKLTAGKHYAQILQRLRAKADLAACPESLLDSMGAQQKLRRKNRRILAILITLCSLVFLSYGLNPGNFHQSEINTSMIRAMYLLTPCMAVPFFWAVYAAYSDTRSIQAEIELLKAAPVTTGKPSPAPAKPDAVRPSALTKVIFILGIVLLVYGFFTGGTADVLTKAVNICTECVGLG